MIKNILLASVLMFSASVSASIVKFSIATDDYADETSWELKDLNSTINSAVYQSPQDDNTTFDYSFDLSEGDYSLTIKDGYGDGITTPSGYSLLVDNVLIADGWNSDYNLFENGSWTYDDNLGGSGYINQINFSIAAVPEPSIIFLMGAGLLGLTMVRRRKK